ncbi:MAG: hypothetical protein ABI273_14145, partial [Lacunisphaera sp.]
SAIKNLNAAQAGGLLDWQSPAQRGTNGLDATFLSSVKSTGFDRSGEVEAALQFASYQTHLFTRGAGAFGNALYLPRAIPNAINGIRDGIQRSSDRVAAINYDYGDAGTFNLATRTLGAAAGELFGANNLVEGAYGFDVEGRQLFGAERAERFTLGAFGVVSSGLGLTSSALRFAPAIESQALRANSEVFGVTRDLVQDARAFGNGYSRGFTRANAGVLNAGVNPTPFFKGVSGGINEIRASREVRALAAKSGVETQLEFDFEVQFYESNPTHLNPFSINYSQRSVASNVEEYIEDMIAKRWDWNRSGPIRVMKQEGQWVSYDNRRLLAAQKARLKFVPVQVVQANEMMSLRKTWLKAFTRRFNDARNTPRVPAGGLSTQPTIVPQSK